MVDIREEIGKQIERLRELNNTLLNTSELDQKTMDEWGETIRQLHQTMKDVLIDAGKTYLVDQLHTCWTCNQQDKVESVYTAGIIFCSNNRCKNYFYYWSMCKTLYNGIPGEIFKQTIQEMIKEKDNTLTLYQ